MTKRSSSSRKSSDRKSKHRGKSARSKGAIDKKKKSGGRSKASRPKVALRTFVGARSVIAPVGFGTDDPVPMSGIRAMCLRFGVTRPSRKLLQCMNAYTSKFVNECASKAIISSRLNGRKTILERDVNCALKSMRLGVI